MTTSDDDFDIWIGRAHGGRQRSFVAEGKRIANLKGRPASGKKASGFTGARIGKGSGAAAVLSQGWSGAGSSRRRVIVKASIVQFKGAKFAAAVRHIGYLQRDGTTRDGERGMTYGRDDDRVDANAFIDKAEHDRHQFRFIVSPEDGNQYDDLKPVVRRLMEAAEEDLGTRLDWVAVDHFNTGHPHSHIVVRGKNDRGKDLIIAKSYLTHGLRERATALVELDLGPRTEREIMRSRLAEIDAERFTDIDRSLLRMDAEHGLIRPVDANPIEQSLKAGRLQSLGKMGLATEEMRGCWRLDADLEQRLRALGERGDIIKAMARAVKDHAPGREHEPFVVHDGRAKLIAPVVGRVIERGLADEHRDRHYLIVDAADGRHHYMPIDAGVAASEGHIVRLSANEAAIRVGDENIAKVAGINHGVYSSDLHRKMDPSATDRFLAGHIKRLEAVRRSTGMITREADGSWNLGTDYLAIATTHEKLRVEREPVRIETLAERALNTLPTHEGPTFLERKLFSSEKTRLGDGFGRELAKALQARLRWLVEQGLTRQEGENIWPVDNLAEKLRGREFRQATLQLSKDLGLNYLPRVDGQIEGIYRKNVTIGGSKYAVVEHSREFSLVPWKPEIEHAIGRYVAAMRRGSSVGWEIGRSRGLGIGMEM